MKYEQLPGIYESEKIETTLEGAPVDEKVRYGMFTFTRDGRLAVVSASDKMVMAYAGGYKIEDDVLKIAVESCVVRYLEGSVLSRRIVSFDGTRLVLEAVGSKSKEISLLTWKKKAPL